ncbi:hypothetical protein [Solibacillus sp. FSL K6-1523]|uniref:hypothetical protein n=1 Tax=Solibacillus sp. FSL K6-1523 TaxID=2921471 RepID=UPI0030FCB17C
MKDFIGTFFTCIVICSVFSFFFLDLILGNIWVLIIFSAFFLALLITIFLNQQYKIEDLQKKVEQLLNNKQD